MSFGATKNIKTTTLLNIIINVYIPSLLIRIYIPNVLSPYDLIFLNILTEYVTSATRSEHMT